MVQRISRRKFTGLSKKEVQQRQKEDGFNELPEQKKQSIFSILFSVVTQPMLLLLIGSGVIYLFLGDVKDALMLLTFVFVVVGITFYQERKTERALEALRDLSSPRALVIRNGQQLRIAGREVVRDDILVLREGDRVPADAIVLYASNLMVDESLLTGESLPVGKSENQSFVFSGTMVTQGHGIAKVTKTGVYTEMGKIGRALENIPEENTLLEKETGRLVKNFAIAGLFLSLLVVVLFGLTRGNWLQGFLAGLSLSMAMLPEEFGVVLLIFLTLGAWRISKRQVLTRHTAAIETLGAATTLCVDKTGTLTLNKMDLQMMTIGGKHHEISTEKDESLPDIYHSLLEYAILASQRDPFDPIEKEIKRLGEHYLANTEHIHNSWKLIHEYVLSKKLLALSHVWESPNKKEYIIAAKGAPEAIADLCHYKNEEIKAMTEKIQLMADRD